MKKSEREKLLVEEIKRAIEQVVFHNSELIQDSSKCDLEKYFCKRIRSVKFEDKVLLIEFNKLNSLKFMDVELMYGEELIKEKKIKQINFIKVIKRGERLYISALVNAKNPCGFDFLEFYTEKIISM